MADSSTMGAVLAYLRNWFERNPVTGERHVVRGAFAVEGGALKGVPDGLLADGQWLRVRGSRINDGLHRWPTEGLKDERFVGEVWALRVPAEVEAVADEMAAWSEANAEALASPYQSESFGGYSYQLAGGGADGAPATWQRHFAARLAPWRRL